LLHATVTLRTLFIIIVLSFGITASFFSRFAALLLYVWFALFRPQEWVWVDITDLHLSFVIGLLVVIPSLATATFPNLTHPISIGMLLFLLSSLTAQIGAVNPAAGWEWLDYLSRLLLVALLATTLINTRRRFVLMMTTMAVSIGFFGAKAGLASKDRVMVLPTLVLFDFWNAISLADVCLDTMEWSGGNTTMETIACRVPVVTMPGRFMRSRHSAAILAQLGVPDTIAQDKEAYVSLAVRLGMDRSWRDEIRERMVAGYPKLYSDPRSTAALETFYAKVVGERQGDTGG